MISTQLFALYLDFDGVLHPDDAWRHPKKGIILSEKSAGHQLFENAPILIEELAPYPQVRIVLSTSWVPALSYRRARNRLPDALRDRVVGSTFHSRMPPRMYSDLERGQQVLTDVVRRRPAAWLALDDNDEGWGASIDAQLVKTDKVLGLCEAQVLATLREKLRATFS